MKGAPREYFVGTAFAVMPNHFITNAHVLTTPHRYGVPLAGIRLDQSGGSFIHIERLLYVSIVLDLALFSTKETVKGHLKLAERRPSWAGFTQLSSIGYPKGDFQRMKQRGRVTYEDPFGVSIGIGFDRDDLSGASGAPILDTKGAVVAVLYKSFKNVAVGVRVERLREFLGRDSNVGVKCRRNGPNPLDACIRMANERLKTRAKNDPVAQYRLWGLYSERRTSGEPSTRLSLLKEAANAGYPLARYDLAWLYLKGEGVTRNEDVGFDWLEKAAAQDFVIAQYDLGRRYLMANTRDVGRAKRWLGRAARQGLRVAEELLKEIRRMEPLWR